LIKEELMTPTQLDYLEDSERMRGTAVILRQGEDERGTYLVLDRTLFYPQGGGQPADRGQIRNADFIFNVEHVGFHDGEVLHYGSFEQGEAASEGVAVELQVDEAVRFYNSRNHTAGHLVGFAGEELHPGLIALKGYHFPEGAYVEFLGKLTPEEIQELQSALEARIRDMISTDDVVEMRLVMQEELSSLCRHVPENLPADKPTRVMLTRFGGMPCGGTHVSSLSKVGSVSIRKIKQRGNNLRVSYSVE
jgi:Ser-tRNA(Ala) deacylase AlaX